MLHSPRPAAARSLAAPLLLLVALSSCSRAYYREDADQEVEGLIREKSSDPRWSLPNFTIALDPRSRFFDPSDPDHPPMPPDDPAAHEFMVEVDGKAGSGDWEKNGRVERLENPDWKQYLGEGIPRTEEGKLKLRLEDALKLARRHSPSFQQQLESLYLSALDVSTERFRFDVQFFAGVTGAAQHRGRKTPQGESNTLSVAPEASFRKRFSAAGELLVSFANSVVWELFGPNEGFHATTLAFSFVQPFLRGGGRVVALEQLTIAERALLANLRAFQRYRQGFFTLVAIGDLGVSGPQRRGGFFGGTGLTGFTGQGSGGFGGVGDVTGFGRGSFGGGGAAGGGGGAGFAGGGAGTVGGFIGLLQQTQQIRNTRDSLNAQLRTLSLLESNLEAGLIDIAQVDQFRQNIETERANLLQAQNSLASSLDSFNRSTLGLPPDTPIEPDDSLIRPFQLIDPSMTEAQDAVTRFIDQLGTLPETPDLDRLRQLFEEIEGLRARISGQLEKVPPELRALDEKSQNRTGGMTEAEQRLFDGDKKRLSAELDELRKRFEGTAQTLERLRTALRAETSQQTTDGLVDLANDLLLIMGELSLVEARARLEMITVEPVGLTADTALEIARAHRLDWMNNRAALVDTWRLIEFNANALRSSLSLRLSGELDSVGNDNPVKFRKESGALRAGLEFDGPFTRLVERNNFRQQLIQYQQDRRQLIQFEDGVHQSMRQALRDIEQLRVNLEIQRRAVTIAIRRVDQTRDALNRPVPPNAPGQAPQALGPTAAQNLLFALSDLRTTQNNLMSVWLNYQAERMQLFRDLGILRLDDDGAMIDEPLEEAIAQADRLREAAPPEVPQDWKDMADTELEADYGPPPTQAPRTPEIEKPSDSTPPMKEGER